MMFNFLDASPSSISVIPKFLLCGFLKSSARGLNNFGYVSLQDNNLSMSFSRMLVFLAVFAEEDPFMLQRIMTRQLTWSSGS